MNTTKMMLVIFAFWVTAMVIPSLVPVCLARPLREPQVQEGAGGSAGAGHIGAIKTVAGNVITLTPDSGPAIDTTVEAAARLVRIAPGEKKLKNATPIQLQDLQVGDRILVARKASDNTKVITATSGASSVATPTIYQIEPRLRAPYVMQSAISVERQLTKAATLSVTYLNFRGFDQLLTINANAPFPGTPGSTVRPQPGEGNIYRYVSKGNFKQDQLIVNSNVRLGTKVQVFGFYTLNYANGDASGVSGFPSNSYNIRQDYGRSSFDTRHRLFFDGTIALPYTFRLSPFMIARSGSPFDITSPNDLNGDSVFNDRPGFVSNAACAAATISPTDPNLYCTPLGTFQARPDLATTPQRILPVNYGTGTAHFVMNLRLTKTFGFGPKTKDATPRQGPGGSGGGGPGGRRGPLFGGGGPREMSAASDRRYNLVLGVSVRNVFNNVNLSDPSGILGSPFFDRSNALQGGPFSAGAANRRLDQQATFSF